jgi:hypothetical protein
VRFTGKCMLYSLCQLPHPHFSMLFLFKINNSLYISFQSFINTQILTISHIITYTCNNLHLSCTFCQCLILFLTFISCSCVLFDSYVLLADNHVNNVSYFPFMSIKKVVPYFCVLHEDYYVIIWPIVRICVFITD